MAAARDYADSIAPGVIARDRAGQVPVAELAALDASGLLGITVPAAHGGPDLPPPVLAEVIRTIAAVDPAIAQVPQAHFLFVDVLAVHGTSQQQDRLLGDVLAGARLGNGLAERGGQHAQDLRTRLRASHGGLRLDGRKYYCTGAISARWIGVSALDDDGQLVLAFVARDADGVQLTDDWNVMGQRATVSGSAVFEDVPVDPGLVVPYQQAFQVPQQLGARAQLVHAAIQTGIAGGALRDAGEFVRTKARPFFEAARAGWADTAAQDPHTIHRYGVLATRVAAAEALLGQAAAALRRSGREPRDAERGGPRLGRGRPGQGVRQRGRGRGGQRPVRAERRQRRRRAARPVPALAQRPHPRQPRPGRLEVPPRRQLPAQQRPATQPRAGMR